ncbi:hypothetical protein [Methanoculleus sp.]|uniref:hypothetical protein n=1 Tax=Methanoculleus sp. TaxID=90427 RepID=UPI00320EF73E
MLYRPDNEVKMHNNPYKPISRSNRLPDPPELSLKRGEDGDAVLSVQPDLGRPATISDPDRSAAPVGGMDVRAGGLPISANFIDNYLPADGAPYYVGTKEGRAG